MPNYRQKNNRNRKQKNKNNRSKAAAAAAAADGEAKSQSTPPAAKRGDDDDDDDDNNDNGKAASRKEPSRGRGGQEHDRGVSVVVSAEQRALSAIAEPSAHDDDNSAQNAVAYRDDDTTGRDKKCSDQRKVIGASETASIPTAMGVAGSKTTTTGHSAPTETVAKLNSTSAQLGKVVVHRVVQETQDATDMAQSEADEADEADIRASQQVDPVCTGNEESEATGSSVRMIIHQVVIEDDSNTNSDEPDDKDGATSPGMQIQEMSDDTSSSDFYDYQQQQQQQQPIICEVESEPETGNDGRVYSPVNLITVQTLPLSSDDQKDMEDVEDVEDDEGRQAAGHDEDQRQRRAQKRVALEAHFLPQVLSPRYLDSIVEENSDMSDARSDCSDNPATRSSAFADDDAHDSPDARAKRANAIFPKSNLDFSKRHKHGPVPKSPTLTPDAIREEPLAMFVEARLLEKLPAAPSFGSSTATLATALEPESEAAEVVFIKSASSSASDLLDLQLDEEETAAEACSSRVSLDTDASDIIAHHLDADDDDAIASETPTATTTVTSCSSRESTPVNRTSSTAGAEAANADLSDRPARKIDEKQPSEILEEALATLKALAACSEKDGEAIRCWQSAGAAARDSAANCLVSAESGRGKSSRLRAQRIIEAPSEPRRPASPTTFERSTSTRDEMNDVREFLHANGSASGQRHEHFARESPPPPPIPPSLRDADFVGGASEDKHDQHHTLQTQPSLAKTNSTTTTTTTITAGATNTSLPSSLTPASQSFLLRQASTDSHCSDGTSHSQCTVINNGGDGTASEGDPEVTLSSPLSDHSGPPAWTNSPASAATVRDPFPFPAGTAAHHDDDDSDNSIKKLRLLCAETVASMPYGDEVLEELANVAQNIGEVRATNSVRQQRGSDEMPYPLPILPHIGDLRLLSSSPPTSAAPHTVAITQSLHAHGKEAAPQRPPPTGAENELDGDAHADVDADADGDGVTWLGVPTGANPKLLVCLSPAQQRAYASGDAGQPDRLLDAHQKFIERRGYHEFTEAEVRAMNSEQLGEQQILKTAAMMKELRKGLSPSPSPSPPPPPIPPPPVPSKSSKTAAKAQSQARAKLNENANAIANAKSTTTDATTAITKAAAGGGDGDASARNANEQQQRSAAIANGEGNQNQNQYQYQNQNQNNNNGHRLLAIIHGSGDGSVRDESKPKSQMPSSTSSLENNSRRSQERPLIIGNAGQEGRGGGGGGAAAAAAQPLQRRPRPPPPTEEAVQTQTTTRAAPPPPAALSDAATALHTADQSCKAAGKESGNFVDATSAAGHHQQSLADSTGGNMQSVDSERSRMFPQMERRGADADADANASHKRYSSIEFGTKASPFCAQLMMSSGQPRRYSNIETRSYESQRRIENGQVVYDVSNSTQDCRSDGDADVRPFAARAGRVGGGASSTAASSTSNVEEIMSALKLNTKNTSAATTTLKAAQTTSSADNATSAFAESEAARAERQRAAEAIKNRQATSASGAGQLQSDEAQTSGSYEEFRQRAKAAAEAAATPPAATTTETTAPPSAPARPKEATLSDGGKPSASFHVDHEKLFKDFDALSQQLHQELESGRVQREQREKSASLYDLSRMQPLQFRGQFEELKRKRHEHMLELEREIERSMKSRQHLTRSSMPRDNTAAPPHTYEIPIRVEGGQPQAPATYEIPVRRESAFQPPDDEERRRRAESMFDLSSDAAHHGQRTASHQCSSSNYNNNSSNYSNAEDWSRYASDLGSSENIARPFAREVEICYQRPRAPQQAHGIRAPRLSASTNDLACGVGGGGVHKFDHNNAYNVRRTHAPMLNQAPVQKARPQYLSCHSMIERDPNPTYISTTSRRGVSPAPPSPAPPAPPSPHVDYDPRQRRASLPHEIHERQLQYISSKEEELKTEFDRLQSERRRLMDEMSVPPPPQQQQQQQMVSPPMQPPQRHYRPGPPKLPTLSEDEVFRQQMAEEWLNKVAEREERRLQKIIKISKINEEHSSSTQRQEEGARIIPVQHLRSAPKPDISEEFLSRVKERRSKLAMPADSDWESGAESQPLGRGQQQPNSDAEDLPPVKVIEGQAEADLSHLPRHLREFARFADHRSEQVDGGHREVRHEEERREEANNNSVSSALKKSTVVKTVKISRQPPPPPRPVAAVRTGVGLASGQEPKPSAPSRKATRDRYRPIVPFMRLNTKLARKQGSTADATTCAAPAAVTGRSHPLVAGRSKSTEKRSSCLLTAQKRRSWSESDLLREIDSALKLAKGFLYADVYKVKNEYLSEPETEYDRPRKMAQLARRQFDGIGPVTNDGMPIILRSEVKEPHQHEWYKRLYQTIHKQKSGDDYVIRYRCPRARPQLHKSSGYQSEPEPNYDSDYTTVKYRTLDRRRLEPATSATNVRSQLNAARSNDKLYGTMPNPVKPGQNAYKNQPGRIEDYSIGHSSVSEKERKEWWDEVMDIFNGHLDQTKLSPHYTEGNLSRALAKESGYTSDSNLVFRKKEAPPSSALSPVEQKQAYKSLQAGGEPPLFGFRKPAPEKSRESPSRYLESDVNIHYKTPIRHEYKEAMTEEELAIRQAEHMQKLYQEERRRKYLQELQDMNSRRHTDNLTPSQKSPIPLNRYDDFPCDLAPKSPNTRPIAVARALYNFQGQSARELSLRKGDVIYIRRQIDKNWYEGEHNAMIGLLPVNYVEIIKKDGLKPQYKKPSEGQARAKYNFQAQSGVELSLNKGELVTLTRRVDDNWFEGKIANRKGIFPVSYVEVLTDIGAEDIAAKTVITEHSTTNLRPSLDTLRTNINNEFNIITQNGHQAPNGILKETKNMHKTDALHVDTSSESITYRALYKYRPQNSDELELLEGDIVHVLEKCDDGWFVGTSQRTGCFGTFPGNYVERA